MDMIHEYDGYDKQPHLKLAQAYVPYQKYSTIFSPQEALKQGTLFPELVRPYYKQREA